MNLLTKWIEKPHPQDLIPPSGISVELDEVVIDLSRLKIPFTQPPRVWIPEVPDTNSMDGCFDTGNNNILIAGSNQADHNLMIDWIKVGDIAVYREGLYYAIHRVVQISRDSKGPYWVFKGDNLLFRDAYKVRRESIEWLSIGVIY